MKVLVIGQGAREHALVRALRLSASVTEVHVAPGSAAMAKEALVHEVSSSDSEALSKLVKKTAIDLVVIGPEQPLAEGLADDLRREGVAVFGPSGEAARLESSKSFAKEFMIEAGVPTARYQVVTSQQELKGALADFEPPYVLKADGLAAGKGVFICASLEEALQVGRDLFERKILGPAGEKVLIEEHQQGSELSFLCLTEGTDYRLLPLAKDHKRLNERDQGPNTGGMGAVAPVSIAPELLEQIESQLVAPSIRQLQAMGLLYRGVLYIGVMVTPKGPKVLEYNVRFGDPEAQVVLPLLEGDWGQVLMAVARGELPEPAWKPIATATVVLAAENYPASPVKGTPIEGDVFFETPSSYFLHGGTGRNSQTEAWVTQGGRVLNALGLGSDLKEALANAYHQADQVKWPGMQLRRDIGD